MFGRTNWKKRYYEQSEQYWALVDQQRLDSGEAANRERELRNQIEKGRRELLEARAALAPTKTYRVRYDSLDAYETVEAHGYDSNSSLLTSGAYVFYVYGERGRETVAEFQRVSSVVELDEEGCVCGPSEVCDRG